MTVQQTYNTRSFQQKALLMELLCLFLMSIFTSWDNYYFLLVGCVVLLPLIFFSMRKVMFPAISLNSFETKLKVDLKSFAFIGWLLLIIILFHNIQLSREFPDEFENFVFGYFAANGIGIYRDVFNHHGPIPVIISHLFYLIFPIHDLAIARIPALFVFLLPLLCFWKSSLFQTDNQKIFTSIFYPSLFLSLFIAFHSWGVFTYQALGGVFIGMTAILMLPKYLDRDYKEIELFFSGFCLAAAVFSGISFVLAALLLVCFAIFDVITNSPAKLLEKLKSYSSWFLGFIVCTIMVLIYLIIFGSVLGFIRQHIYFNIEIYNKFIGNVSSLRALKTVFVFPSSPVNSSIFIGFLICFFALISLFSYIKRQSMEPIKLVKAFVFLVTLFFVFLYCSPRNMKSFHSMGSLCFSIILLSASLGFIEIYARKIVSVLMVLLAFCLMIIDDDFSLQNFLQKKSCFSNNIIVQTLTTPQDRVVFWPLSFDYYFYNKRLPGSFYSFYLPWHAAGAESLSTCRLKDPVTDLKEKHPALIMFDSQSDVWGFKWVDYARDLERYVRDNYYNIIATDIYLRPDIADKKKNLLMQNNWIIKEDTVETLNLNPSNKSERIAVGEIEKSRKFIFKLPAAVKDKFPFGISISLATYCKKNLPGEIFFSVCDKNGALLGKQVIKASSIQDNSFVFIPLKGKGHPASVTISSSSPSGKSATVWAFCHPDYANMTIIDGQLFSYCLEYQLFYQRGKKLSLNEVKSAR